MIPAFDPTTGALPAGIHESDWAEFVARFGTTQTRRTLLAGMHTAFARMARAGCTRVYVGGSFVTATAEPGDWDACYDPTGVREDLLPPSILEESSASMKLNFQGELFILLDSAFDFLSFFQANKAGQTVGVVALDPHSVLE